MPKPIRTAALATGALLLMLSLISASIYWPKIVLLDWGFYRALLVVGSPLIYVLIAAMTGQTPCYWLAIGLLKLETFQWLVIECCGKFMTTYQEMYPVRERQIRIGVADMIKDKIRSYQSYEDYLAASPKYAEDMEALRMETIRQDEIRRKGRESNG